MSIRYRVMRGCKVILWSDLIRTEESGNTKPYAYGTRIGDYTNRHQLHWMNGVDLFFNILENVQGVMKIRLFLEDGNFVDGWINEGSPIEIFNQDELFDGRFNA